jgi:hypothetical protein
LPAARTGRNHALVILSPAVTAPVFPTGASSSGFNRCQRIREGPGKPGPAFYFSALATVNLFNALSISGSTTSPDR